MTELHVIRARAAQLHDAFQANGAVSVDADILQPAETLLDLYGEDIRGRAYVTNDPLHGEMMLRPDFTVPVVQAHMAHGAEPARYTYMGLVFRKQDHRGARANEYLQVGYEVFDRGDPSQADAEVFALFSGVLKHLPLQAVTGDIGILKAAIAGLHTSDLRKAALQRHMWRPDRFRALLDRFGGRTAPTPERLAMLARFAFSAPETLIAEAGQMNGKRTEGEILGRIANLLADAIEAPIPATDLAQLDRLLALKGPAQSALADLRAMQWPAISSAVDRLAARLTAMEAHGINTKTLAFDASYGRTTMEYYDGFVFGFRADNARGLPPVATGGRYDALTAVLGQGEAIPAVGGVVRPAVVVALEGEA
jgi:ATP phosphoribosyltransferase regulatory subunit